MIQVDHTRGYLSYLEARRNSDCCIDIRKKFTSFWGDDVIPSSDVHGLKAGPERKQTSVFLSPLILMVDTQPKATIVSVRHITRYVKEGINICLFLASRTFGVPRLSTFASLIQPTAGIACKSFFLRGSMEMMKRCRKVSVTGVYISHSGFVDNHYQRVTVRGASMDST